MHLRRSPRYGRYAPRSRPPSTRSSTSPSGTRSNRSRTSASAFPSMARASSERTELRVAFDDHNLYFAVVLHDSDPEGIRRSILHREGRIDQDDNIRIGLDTYNHTAKRLHLRDQPLRHPGRRTHLRRVDDAVGLVVGGSLRERGPDHRRRLDRRGGRPLHNDPLRRRRGARDGDPHGAHHPPEERDGVLPPHRAGVQAGPHPGIPVRHADRSGGAAAGQVPWR